MQQISFAVFKLKVSLIFHLEKNNMKCTYMQNSVLAISPQENDLETLLFTEIFHFVSGGRQKRSQQNIKHNQKRY